MWLAALGAVAACQPNRAAPLRARVPDAARVVAADTAPAPSPAARDRDAGATGDARVAAAPSAAASTAEAWARWPMPNANLPGLPNRHSYDTQTPGVVVDRITGLMWQRRLPNQFLTWQKAREACRDLSLGDHHDWRLPSRIELVSLLDTTRTQPSIDIDVFPLTPSDWFWTSSRAADDPNAAWYVYFYFGYPKTDDLGNTFSVRCVRSVRSEPSSEPSPASPVARYEVKAKVVRDVATGLRWQRVSAAKPLPFESARAYCSHLNLGGDKHWRVPTLGELLTLIDERAATAPMIDRTTFLDTPAEPFWTSSTFANGSELAWYVRFDHGNGLYGRLTEPFRVRCVL